ncbi:MAG: ribonuclease III [bacterium]|nr:ribonuclease III [bacterium]
MTIDTKRKKELRDLEKKIKYNFKNKEILNVALTHSSYAYEKNSKNNEQNERLEFLGDVVLSLIVSDYIYHLYPKKPEGELAKIRASLVNKTILAKIAKEMDIGQYLLLGKGEELTGGRRRSSILANTIEAAIGAIYLDRGIKEAWKFVISQLKGDIELLEKDDRYSIDSKTLLQEITQETFKVLPEYKVVRIKGPDHRRSYEVDVLINGKVSGFGAGRSKKEAEQKAALMAIEKFEKKE